MGITERVDFCKKMKFDKFVNNRVLQKFSKYVHQTLMYRNYEQCDLEYFCNLQFKFLFGVGVPYFSFELLQNLNSSATFKKFSSPYGTCRSSSIYSIKT